MVRTIFACLLPSRCPTRDVDLEIEQSGCVSCGADVRRWTRVWEVSVLLPGKGPAAREALRAHLRASECAWLLGMTNAEPGCSGGSGSVG